MRQHASGLRRDRLLPGTDDDRRRRDAGLGDRGEHMGEQRAPGDRMQDLGAAERMRVPSPAASTIARQVRAFIGKNLRGALIAEPAMQPKAAHCSNGKR